LAKSRAIAEQHAANKRQAAVFFVMVLELTVQAKPPLVVAIKGQATTADATAAAAAAAEAILSAS